MAIIPIVIRLCLHFISIKIFTLKLETPAVHCFLFLRKSLKFFSKRPFIFSCFEDYPEDYGTTKYLMNLLKNNSIAEDVEFVSFYDLQVDSNGILLPDEVVCRDSDKFMYQQFIRTPKFEVPVDSGWLSGFITVSCFMLGAQPSAVYCRFSLNKIIGTEAYYVPLVVN